MKKEEVQELLKAAMILTENSDIEDLEGQPAKGDVLYHPFTNLFCVVIGEEDHGGFQIAFDNLSSCHTEEEAKRFQWVNMHEAFERRARKCLHPLNKDLLKEVNSVAIGDVIYYDGGPATIYEKTKLEYSAVDSEGFHFSISTIEPLYLVRPVTKGARTVGTSTEYKEPCELLDKLAMPLTQDLPKRNVWELKPGDIAISSFSGSIGFVGRTSGKSIYFTTRHKGQSCHQEITLDIPHVFYLVKSEDWICDDWKVKTGKARKLY